MNLRPHLLAWATGICLLGTSFVHANDKTKEWDSSIALGLNLSSGNSDSILFHGRFATEREWPSDIWRLEAGAAYGESDGDTNVEKLDGLASYQHLFSERMYGGLRLEVLRDTVADIKLRAAFSPSLGYYFIKSEVTRLSAEIGPSFVYENLESGDESYMALRIGERFEHQFENKSKLWQSFEIVPQVDDWDNFVAVFELGAEAVLNSAMNLRVVFQDRYDNQPSAGREKNDMLLTSSLVFKF